MEGFLGGGSKEVVITPGSLVTVSSGGPGLNLGAVLLTLT